MAKYREVTFNEGVYGRAAEYTDSSAIVLAIRNILLTRRGNYPFNPTFGMNIQKYQFELLDATQLSQIKSELSNQIAEFLPAFQNVEIDVRKVTSEDGKEMLGIAVSSKVNGETTTTSFILYEQNGTLEVINETN